MAQVDRETLKQMLDGIAPIERMRYVMSGDKDPDRFFEMVAIHQSRVAWPERILLPYGEGLFIVRSASGEHVVKCRCGHVFGPYTANWKLEASIFVRDSQALIDEVYPHLMGPDAEWMQIREFYCPGCQLQLEVEAVPPGYPIVFDFLPDLDGFYRDWLGRPDLL